MTDYLKLARDVTPPPAPADPSNPYLALVQDEQRQAQARARSLLETALKDNPDTAAERLRLSKTSGLPLRVVENNLDDVRIKEQARAVDLVKLAQQSPVLSRQLLDPTFTQTSVDDLDTLSKIENTVAAAARYVMGADGKGGLLRDIPLAATDVALGATAGVGELIFNIAGTAYDLVGWKSGAQEMRGRANASSEARQSFGLQPESDTGKAVKAGLGSAGTNLAILPIGLERGLFQTAEAAGSAVAGIMGAGVGADAYLKAREAGKTQVESALFGVPQGAFEFLFEKIPASKLFGDIAANTSFVKTLRNQLGPEVVTEQFTTLAQDFNEWMSLNPDKTVGQFIAERPDAAYQTLIATLVGVGVQTTTITAINKAVEKATDTALSFQQDMLAEQMKLVNSSMLRQRSPEQFRAYVERVIGETENAKKEVYVDAEVLSQLPQDVLAQLPASVQEALPEALAINATVAIPMADVLSVAPGTPLEEVLNDHARLTPDAMTRKEAEKAGEVLQREAETIMQQAADQEAARQEFEAVKTDLAQQVTQAGRYSPAVADAYAAGLTHFFVAYGSRMGLGAKAFYDAARARGFRIAGQPSTQDNTLEEGARPGTISVDAYHFSKAARPMLSTAFFGTGLKGSARDEIMSNPDTRLQKRLSFYFDKGTGIRPEAGVGAIAHRARLSNIYDANADVLGLRSGDARAFESKLIDLGYSGYADRLEGTQPGQVVLLGDQAVEPELLGPVSQIQTGEVLPALPREEAAWQTIAEGDGAQARMERMQANPAWSGYEMRLVDGRLEVRKTSGVYEQSRVKDMTPEVRKLLKNLTPTEQRKITDSTAAKVIAQLKKLPSAKEMAAVALGGKAKRGWYKNSAEAISAVFGPDAPRFASLLAATSPQCSVEINLLNALNIWKNWIAAGRPTEREAIIDVMGASVQGGRGRASVLDAWINNSVRALTADNPADAETTRVFLSGPKVNSFFLNLIGVTDEVTNDAWMANYALVDQVMFSGSMNVLGTDPGKGTGYLAMSARTREAAAFLTKTTGETWTPAEVQETVWSWAKTLYELQVGDMTATRALQEGKLTDDLINSTPDFSSLFSDPTYGAILKEAGYGDRIDALGAGTQRADDAVADEGSDAGAEATAFAAEDQRRLQLQAARRLERLRAQRAADKGGVSGTLQQSAGNGAGRYSSGGSAPLEGAPAVAGATGPDARLVAVAEQYARDAGIVLRRQAEYVKVDPERAARIAAAYEAMQHAPNDPAVREAYEDLQRQVLAQYLALERAGYRFYFFDETNDPYQGNPWNAMRDLRANQTMAVFATEAGFGTSEFDPEGNPLLGDTGLEWGFGSPDGQKKRVLFNDLFRAVHDAFGHGLEGAGFRAEGEENAWQAHARLFTGPALGALTSETRGQNSWLNYGPHGETNRTAKVEDTVFADQKTGLMPSWTWTEGRAADASDTLEQSAYHGSPYRGIDKFSLDKIGTGEGEKAYGWGLYFAGAKEIAEHYRKTVSLERGEFSLVDKAGGQPVPESTPGYAMVKDRLKSYGADLRASDVPQFKEVWENDLKVFASRAADAAALRAKYESEGAENMVGAADAVAAGYAARIAETKAAIALLDQVKRQEGGQLYTVEVPDDTDLLDYDAQLKDQPEKVRKALEGLGFASTEYQVVKTDGGTRGGFQSRDAAQAYVRKHNLSASIKEVPVRDTGKDIYTALTGNLGSDKAASLALAAAGIPGLRYLDANSRGAQADSKSHNYVIFDESAVQKTGELYQQARGTFNPKTLEVVLNPNTDLTTLWHEMGHFFLEVLADVAAQPNAPAQLATDWQTFLGWAGVTDQQWRAFSLDQKRPYHERWAESVEQYVMEGKVPNKELQPLMRRFAAWLKAVYGSIQKFLAARGQAAPAAGEALGQSVDPVAQAQTEGYEGTDAGEAAEWLAAKAKGLDMSEAARMERARAMGFDTSKKLYHSTLADTKWFAPVGKFMGFTGTSGISVTDNPKMASRYLDRYGEYGFVDGKPNQAFSKNVIPVFIKPGKVLERDEPFPMQPGLGLGAPLPDGYAPAHKRMGYDTLIRNDAVSRKGPVKHSDAKNAIKGKEYVLTDPSQVRSVFAAFDPDNAASGDLLAQDPAAQPGPPMALNDDIRRVMDRMLATDEQIAEANEAAGLLPDEESDAEANDRLRKRSMADLKWTVRARDKVIRQLQKKAADTRKHIAEEVTTEANQLPEVRAKAALDALQITPEHQGLVDGWKEQRAAAEKAERDRLVAALYEANPEATGLKRGQLLSKNRREIANKVDAFMIGWDKANPKPARPINATDADVATVADSFGYESVDAMLEAIAAFGSKQDYIDGRTEQRMLEEHGDLMNEDAIRQAANEAVHNEARARSLATELRTQSEMLNPRDDTGKTNSKGQRVTVNALVEAAKQFAANVVGRTPLRDLKNRAWQHTAAERRAAKAWQQATAKGATADAVKAKQDQMLNHAAAKAAIDAQAEGRKILEFFARVTKGNDETVVEKGRDPDVVNAARAVLALYGVQTPASKNAAAYLETLKRNDPEMWAVIEPMVQEASANAQPMLALTVDELRGLHAQIEGMWYLAKRSRQMEVDGDLMDIEDAADELHARMVDIGIPDTVPGETGALTKAEQRTRSLRFFGAALKRVEQWVEGMDGKYGGPFLRYVFQPIKDAADRYRKDRVVYRRKFQALVNSIAPSMRHEMIEAPELGYTFGRGHNGIGTAELLHALLHTGNDSNKRKLLLGRQWATENADGTLDTSKWDAFIARLVAEGKLTPAHFDFLQGVWDLMEETKPLAQKAHRDVFGRYFAEVTATPFVDPFGASRRGGYVPAQADPEIVPDATMRELAERENESMAYAFPATSRGFTKGRVEYNRPLKLDLRTLPQHLDKVLLFSHMEPAVRSAAKLLRNKGVSQALNRIDPSAYAGTLLPWLNRAAKQIVETPVMGDGKISRVLSVLRARAGAALMFANVSNTVQQITGLSTAAVKVKPAHLMRAAATFIAHPKATREAVWDASPYMADRASNEVSAMNGQLEAILLNPSVYERAQEWSQQHAYFLQTAFDNALSPIVWTGAFNQAVEQGMDDEAAVKFADGVVRQTQGSTLPEDISRIESGPAYARMFTQFVGYFNMMANTNATAVKQIASEVGLRKGAGKALYVVLMGLLVPLWVAEAIAQGFRGGPDDEDKDGYLDDWLAAVFGLGTIKGILAQVPFIGQLGNAAIARTNNNPADDKVSLSPAVSLLEGAAGAPTSVYKAIVEDGSSRKAIRDVASLVSIATGLPATAVARPAGYLADVAEGRTNPSSAVDAVRGTVTGVPAPDTRR